MFSRSVEMASYCEWGCLFNGLTSADDSETHVVGRGENLFV